MPRIKCGVTQGPLKQEINEMVKNKHAVALDPRLRKKEKKLKKVKRRRKKEGQKEKKERRKKKQLLSLILENENFSQI